jgi:hypothetical protein
MFNHQQRETDMTTATQFKAIRDGDDWFVCDATIGAYSFAMVTREMFDTRKQAEAQAKAHNAKGQPIEVSMMDTPDRFEAVADTKYGCAW